LVSRPRTRVVDYCGERNALLVPGPFFFLTAPCGLHSTSLPTDMMCMDQIRIFNLLSELQGFCFFFLLSAREICWLDL